LLYINNIIEDAGTKVIRHNQISCSVVIVCFHSLAELRECVRVVYGSLARVPFEVIVVNNSQSDMAEIAAFCDTNKVVCLQSDVNLGYGAGCNLGAAYAQGRHVFFVNPDVRISPASIELLVKKLDENADLVAIGPLQGNARGSVRGKRRAVGQLWSPAKKTLRSLCAGGRLALTGFLNGGVLMVRKEAFDRSGGFDENVFLFHEDDDLCLRLAQQGRLAYATEVLAFHDAGKSTPPSVALTKTRAWHLGNSKVYVARKHYGKWAGCATLLQAAAKFANPAMLTARGRMKARYFLAGAWAAQFGPKSAAKIAP